MFEKRKSQEICGLLLTLAAIIVLLSLVSYSIHDYKELAEGAPVNNIIGPFGANISSVLRTAFGYSSYIIFFIMAIAGWSMLRKGSLYDNMERILSLLYLLLTTSSLLSLLYRDSVPQFSGGYIGYFFSGFFLSFASTTGAYLIVIILNLIALILMGSISLSFITKSDMNINRLGSIFKKLTQKIFRWHSRNEIPLNTIDEEIRRRKKKKGPWITKKTIVIYPDGKEPVSEFAANLPKLLEMSEPDTDTTFTEFSSHENDDDFFNNDLTQDISDCPEYREDPYTSEVQDYESDANEETFELEEATAEGRTIISDGIAINRIKSVVTDEVINDALCSEPIEVPVAVENTASPVQIQNSDNDGSTVTTLVKTKTVEQTSENKAAAAPAQGTVRVFSEIDIDTEYVIPTTFLKSSAPANIESWKLEVRKNSELLVKTLLDFGIESRVIKVNKGPVITLYELQIAAGIKVNRIVGLSDDIAMALAAYRVRIVAPIPGKSAVGIEIPNEIREMVTLGDVLKSNEHQSKKGWLKVALGKDILGKPITLDLKTLPHLLIAGATGSGKSVCVNSIISSLIYFYDPNSVRFILVDPKMVELQLYNGLPHLLTPVITDPLIAPKALKWATFEMERRYKLLSDIRTRDLENYNKKIVELGEQHERLPYIVIIIDELADLMMIAPKEIEGYITRIAQKARAVGIHLVLATQRPSVNVITGIIKANFPARIAFQVSQKTDSRTIIDQNGAEKLLGKGDMLYQSPRSSFPVRVQGAFISEDETQNIVDHLKELGNPDYIDIEDDIFDDDNSADEDVEDELFVQAITIVEETKKASASYLQRRLSIGYNRAARIIEMMESRGYIGQQQGSKARDVFI